MAVKITNSGSIFPGFAILDFSLTSWEIVVKVLGCLSFLVCKFRVLPVPASWSCSAE